jgi:para-nitrobenzyl esterase
MLRLILICAVLAAAAVCANAEPAPARIDSGRLQGVPGEQGVVVYKGVPYAEPPVGPRRWRPPAPVPPWSGVRAATAFGSICPQNPGLATPAGATQSEDCLYLNVWAPPRQDAPAPVMVWIHGGGDDTGTATQPQFDGTPFAKDGIVFVSLDYRLGPLGWFAHPALTKAAAPAEPLGSYGLMDEIAALQWVKRNIAAFGGDPKRVTIAGESAGGEAVLYLMTTPAARGLFAGAIAESASGWGGGASLADAERTGAALAAKAGAPKDADAEALRALPVQALLAATGDGTGVVIDGRLVKQDVAASFAAGRSAPVPLLIGSNDGEDSLLGREDPKAVLGWYKPDEVASLRTAYGAQTPDDEALGRALLRDGWMGAPARWYAARQSARAPTWLYQFAYVPEVIRLRRHAASHGFEMLFAFEALRRAPIPLAATPSDETEMTLVHACWASFVKTGAPACPGAPWPRYTPAADQLLDFGADGGATPVAHFDKAAYDVLDKIEAKRLSGAPPR